MPVAATDRRGEGIVDLHIGGLRAVVSGGAGGIGAAVVRTLEAEGAVVAVIDRVAVPGRLSVVADIRDEAAVAAAVDTAAARLGGIDLLVCAAGISGPVGTPLGRTSLADWDAVMAVNVTGTFLTLRSALPWLAASAQAAVVIVASDSAFVATGGMVPYGASKAAVLQLARAAAVELQPDGIRVAAVCPSIVDTPMSRGDLDLATGFADVAYPVQSADELAGTIVYLLSPAARAIAGTGIVSDFGFSARSAFPA